MLMDDPIELQLSNLREQVRGFVGEEAAEMAAGIVLHAIKCLSIVGIPVVDSWKDLKQKPINERVLEVLTDMNNQSKTNHVNKDYFKSEEFQTLLALMLEQLATTHDKDKLHLLASALANSATSEFSTENRKELFMRILRNLAPEHVQMLRRVTQYSVSEPNREELAVLQALVGNGLVRESFRPDANFSEPPFGSDWSEAEIKRAIKDYIKAVLLRSYRISDFGEAFMKFIS